MLRVVCACCNRFWPALLIEGLVAAGEAVVLKQDVVANGIDEGTETVGLA